MKLRQTPVYRTTSSTSLLNRFRGTGTPMFSREDCFATAHFLDQMIRGLIVKLGITNEDFNEMYAEYASEVLGQPRGRLHTKGNLTRALKQGRISPMIFQRTLAVLGLYLNEVEISLVDNESNEISFSLSEAKKISRGVDQNGRNKTDNVNE